MSIFWDKFLDLFSHAFKYISLFWLYITFFFEVMKLLLPQDLIHTDLFNCMVCEIGEEEMPGGLSEATASAENKANRLVWIKGVMLWTDDNRRLNLFIALQLRRGVYVDWALFAIVWQEPVWLLVGISTLITFCSFKRWHHDLYILNQNIFHYVKLDI